LKSYNSFRPKSAGGSNCSLVQNLFLLFFTESCLNLQKRKKR
jgi:hypothetical protein